MELAQELTGRIALTVSSARGLSAARLSAELREDLGWACEATLHTTGPPVTFWSRVEGEETLFIYSSAAAADP